MICILKIYSHNVWNVIPCEKRKKLIKELIYDFDADICLFQECSPDRIRNGNSSLPNLIKNRYSEVYAEKSDINYTPIFYKKDKFHIIDCGYFQYVGLNDAGSKSVTWAIMNDIENNKFGVISTHFWWMFDSEKDNIQRIENANELKKHCEFLIEKFNSPIIIGGDFNNGINSLQGDKPYKYMLDIGFIDIRHSAEISCDKFTHRDCPPEDSDKDSILELPTMRNLDYIFTYGNLKFNPKKFNVITNEKALISSDHCPLTVVF